MSVGGLVVGSFVVVPLLKRGRRKVIIYMNIIASFGIIATCFANIYALLIGKFVFGFASGALIVAGSIFQNESMPAERGYWFGFTTNFGVIIGISLVLALGFGLPDPTADPIGAS